MGSGNFGQKFLKPVHAYDLANSPRWVSRMRLPYKIYRHMANLCRVIVPPRGTRRHLTETGICKSLKLLISHRTINPIALDPIMRAVFIVWGGGRPGGPWRVNWALFLFFNKSFS